MGYTETLSEEKKKTQMIRLPILLWDTNGDSLCPLARVVLLSKLLLEKEHWT